MEIQSTLSHIPPSYANSNTPAPKQPGYPDLATKIPQLNHEGASSLAGRAIKSVASSPYTALAQKLLGQL